ncbi:MAG: tetratricopeptide repeat protein [Gemmatimonadetes bacterium]|nr:tetratricopeptide repeat protein [Gemmatimonadota bacterium]MYG17218.1 tetratricopeptide repeat protein [Gemmatimonadota bacterium]
MFLRKVAVCVLFALGFALLIPVAADAQKIELRSAKIYIREIPPQTDKAMALLETALEKDPGNNDAHYLLGLIHYRKGNFDLMFQNWEAVTFDDLDKKDKEQFRNTLGSMIRTNYQTGQQSFEQEKYADAAQFYGRSVNATSMLQDILRSIGKKNEAEEADNLETAKQQGYLYWGYAALNAEDYEGSRMALETLAEADPDKFEAWDGLVRVYYNTQVWDKVIIASDRVIELSEAVDLNTYLIKRDAYFNVADTANVITTYEQAMEAFPEEKSLYRDLGSIHSSKNNLEQAIEVLEKGTAALPEDQDLLRYLGTNYYNKGLSDRDAGNVEAASAAFNGAIESMNKLLVLEPKSIEAHDVLGDAYVGLASIETDDARKMELFTKGEEHQKTKMELITSGAGM